jgi:hypothetical protein
MAVELRFARIPEDKAEILATTWRHGRDAICSDGGGAGVLGAVHCGELLNNAQEAYVRGIYTIILVNDREALW